MRILWLKSDVLLPLDKGGKLRTWHLMRHLARRHEITYLSFADPDQSAADIRARTSRTSAWRWILPVGVNGNCVNSSSRSGSL